MRRRAVHFLRLRRVFEEFFAMAFQGDSIFWVETDKIVANPYQPRREFDEQKLKELSESIRMYGVLQPLTVTKKEIQTEDGAFYSEYELIAGERRWRASKLAHLEQVPVIIRDGNDTEQEKLELAIIENLQREDLNAVDRALAFRQLADMFELSHSQVAKKVGRSREYVSNTIRLLQLPEYMLSSIKSGDISEGHARSLLMLKDRPEEQDVVYREILLKKLSVREVERITRKIASDKVRKKNWAGTDPELIEIERQFTDTLGTRVQISKTDFGGKLTIDYFSEDDLQNLLTIVKSQGRMSQKVETAESTDENDAGPVMQAAGAAVLAKLAQATPLQTVGEQTNEETSHAHSTSPAVEPQSVEGVTHETPTPSVTAEEQTIENRPETVQEFEPTSEPENTSEPEKSGVGWSFSFKRPVTEPKPVSESEPVPEPVVEESARPVTEQSFDKVTQPTVESPQELATPESMPPEVNQPENNYVPINPAEPEEVEVKEIEKKEEKDDDDLYSIRNFSL